MKYRVLLNLLVCRRFCILLLLWILMAQCSKDKDDIADDKYLKKPLCESNFIPKSYRYKVVGFYPSWRHSSLPVSEIRWDKLTRVVYAFAIPNADGTIDTRDLTMIKELTDAAHYHGVEVYISVGGGDGSANFPLLGSKEETRQRFVNEVRQYVFENCLDGVDIDWEYWSGYSTNTVIQSESNSLVSILQSLKKEFEPFDLGISIDLGASHWSGKHFTKDIVQWVDELQIMCYDFTGPWSAPVPHSSYEQSIGSGNSIYSTGLAYWVNFRVFPKEKILLGVPFYGRDFDSNGGEGVTYSDIIKISADAYLNDRVNNIYYNGVITMEKKASYVVEHDYPGIMIWEIGQDSSIDSVSLLNVIALTLNTE